MATWPKTIYIKGVGIPVETWEELDEVIERYGGASAVVIGGTSESPKPEGGASKPKGFHGGGAELNHTDRTLLQEFVTNGSHGVPTSEIGPALGKRGKSIRPALEAWSRRIGLATEENASPFAPMKTSRGRGFRLTGIYPGVARSLLGLGTAGAS